MRFVCFEYAWNNVFFKTQGCSKIPSHIEANRRVINVFNIFHICCRFGVSGLIFELLNFG